VYPNQWLCERKMGRIGTEGVFRLRNQNAEGCGKVMLRRIRHGINRINPMTLTFQKLLETENIDARQVKLLRHSYKKADGCSTPYDLWRTDSQAYLLYNKIQRLRNFRKTKYFASFVVDPKDDLIFTGIFEVEGISNIPEGIIDPVSGITEFPDDAKFFDLQLIDPLNDLIGKLVIDWGGGTRSFAQKAENQPKPVLEIRKRFEEPKFPGFGRICNELDELPSLPETWKEVLRSVQGVYLLRDVESSQLYVGSAYGKDGIWGRWEDYISTGHGGNKELKKLKSRNFVFSILYVAASDATLKELIEVENLWKERLGSRQVGLNAN
jgi:hypothetical protein